MKPSLPRFTAAVLVAASLAFAAPSARAAVFTNYILQWGAPGAGNGQFDQPVGVAVDGTGNVFVTDMANDRVQVFNGTGSFLFSFGGTGGGNGQFRRPYGISIYGGDVFVVDTGNFRVQKFDLSGNYLLQWGVQGSANGKFQRPRCVSANGLGNVYVTDDSLNRVQIFDTFGTYLNQWGSTGTGNGQFRGAIGVATEPGGGAVWVADSANARVQRFDYMGNFLAAYGTPGNGPGQYQSPVGIEIYGGEYFVSDTFNDRMQKYTGPFQYSGQWGTTGTGNSQFNRPHASAADGVFIYVADTQNHRIQKFGPPSDSSCAVCTAAPEVCCEAMPQIGGPWTNALVGTRNADPAAAFPWVVTIFNLNSNPLPAEDNDWASMSRYTGPGPGWTVDSLGSVFGLTLDEYGNIFVAHTSCYATDRIGQVFGGAPGAIYRIDAVTGAIKTFCVLPNVQDPYNLAPSEAWPGLGNITYDCAHHQFFATDLEDGRIYRIQPNGVNGVTGTVAQVFDPLQPDDGLPGFAPLGERLWGIQVHAGRVYYAVYGVDTYYGNAPNEIRSVALSGTGAILPATDKHEIYMPLLPNNTFSFPVADISFNAQGRMLLGERGILDRSYPVPHMARVLEYQCAAGCWIPGNTYNTGCFPPETNAEGGVDYDYHAYNGASGAKGRVWATSDAIHIIGIAGYNDDIYGFQGLRPNLPVGSRLNSMLVDFDGPTVSVGDKSEIGDVEAPGCPPPPETGTICGSKFIDTNRNGIQDGGEAGAPGWTVQLYGTGGTFFATTDANGNFCINAMPGTYTLAEVGQLGWVQTAPPGGAYTGITVVAGVSQNGFAFGNTACAASPCNPVPPMLAAWWPFDEAPGSSTTADATHLSPVHNIGLLGGGATLGGAGAVGQALCLAGSSGSAHARVPNGQQLGLEFGRNAFAIAAWVNVPGGTTGQRILVEKRKLNSAAPYRTLGWALYLEGQQCWLEIGNGYSTQLVPGPTLPSGQWTHVAVAVDRAPSAGHWYLNGTPIAAMDFVPVDGPVSSNADVWIGTASPPFGHAAPFGGCIDELQLYAAPPPAMTALPAATVAKAVGGSTGVPIAWCPEYALMPSVTTICKDKTTVQVCFNICNFTGSPQSYHWSMSGLPVGPGCTWPGPTQFSPAAGTVTVAAGCSAPICVTITRPGGFTAQNATSCFALSFVNDATGRCYTKKGTLRVDNTCWCATLPAGITAVAGRIVGVPVTIGLGYPCDPITSSPYRIVALPLNDAYADPLAVSLDGLAPGTPVTGVATPDATGNADVTVHVTYPRGYDPSAPYEIALEMDTDADGTMERLGGTIVVSSDDSTQVVGVPAAPLAVESLRLVASPNPFTGGSAVSFSIARAQKVSVGVYDLGGRLVRSLQNGPLAAGAHRFEWNGRDESGARSPAGVYFVRADSESRHLETKLVKLR